jgi:hypothetical protein
MAGAMSSSGRAGSQRAVRRPWLPPGPLADLKALIYELYMQAGPPTLDAIADAIARNEDLIGAPSRDTVKRLIGDPGKPGSQAEVVAVVTVLARLALLDVDHTLRQARDLWLAAVMASGRPPQGGVRVSEADPRQLGVHAAISVPGAPDGVPPEYVSRDADGGESGVRARVAAAASRGGFVLLVGGSSVGKTRCAYEAVTAVLPDWWLVHPVGPGEVAALAAAPPQRTVVWLDELQRYLDGEHGLTGGMVRALLNAPDPVVIIGTLWPDWYSAWTAVPGPSGDPRARERQVLDLADVTRIAPELSTAEQGRARAAAARDQRVKAALDTSGYGLTQTLAAAPQLVARWEDARATAPYGWAVMTAALDAARLGARAPLSGDYLRTAAPGYCTSAQRAEAPENWFDQAMAYATQKLHGAVAPLSPQGAAMGQIRGYIAADYLIQHATRERRRQPVPASTWDAAVAHLRDPDDVTRLAGAAARRELNRYAILLYRHAADDTGVLLAELLHKRGDLDEAEQILRARADAGDAHAAFHLAGLLRDRGDLDQAERVLRGGADAGDGHAARQLADLLRERGDLDQAERVLRAGADAGDGLAAEQLADLLREQGDLDKLRARADAGDAQAACQLVGLLWDRGDLDQAERVLRAGADAGDGLAAFHLAGLLRDRGDLDQAERVLRAGADAGDGLAAEQLARLLRERGDLHGLRARADADDGSAIWQLANLLLERGDLDETEQVLRARADAGSMHAAWRLSFLLRDRGDLDGLRGLADAGSIHAAPQLIGLLRDRGDLDQVERVLRAQADAGDIHDAWQLDDLPDQGELDEAAELARADGFAAARQLVGLLRERGDLDGLRGLADAGNIHAAPQLAGLLQDRGELDQAEQILRVSALVGDAGSAEHLAILLARQGREAEAERLSRFGLTPDGATACM